MADVGTFVNWSSTESSNSPAGSTNISTGLDDNLRVIQAQVAIWRDGTGWAGLNLTSVAGTNTVTAACTPGPATIASGQRFTVIPANTNTGATTLEITPAGGASLGAKNVFWNGVACVGGELRASIPALVIYDGTQYHIIANGFNAPFNDAHAVVSGSADPTKKVRIEADGLTTATTRVLTMLDADFTLGTATQAQQEAGTVTTVPVTPGRQQYHPSAAKGWLLAGVTGNVLASYNVNAISDTGAGVVGVDWLVDFSSTSYVAIVSVESASPWIATVDSASRAVSSTSFRCQDSAGAEGDPDAWHVVVFGDQ